MVERLNASERVRDFVARRRLRSGAVRDIVINMDPIELAGKPCTLAVLNDVTERVRAEDEVRRLNEDLERRVRERTAELKAANSELEAYDYTVVHDLRAPLNRILGFAEILVDKHAQGLDAAAREVVGRISNAGQQMEQLVTDLLELSTVARGELVRGPVDLGALAQSVGDALRAADPGRDVELVVAPDLHERADARLVRVVLENLVNNAWKFTSKTPAARIEVGAEERDGIRVFFVRDNGPGFDASKADQLFTPFKRLHSSADFAGTGVGLATVQRIVRRHGGRAWAEGEIGRGATFHFTLSS